MHKFINKDKKERIKSAVEPMLNTLFDKNTDPDGSYTGKPENKKEKPVQDADDL
ncbi:MAG: hypothetical protein IKV58_02875 [Oscillospiraceae bacterium]|nr:hypothetical protein [Oscillospiraceae bacterium]